MSKTLNSIGSWLFARTVAAFSLERVFSFFPAFIYSIVSLYIDNLCE